MFLVMCSFPFALCLFTKRVVSFTEILAVEKCNFKFVIVLASQFPCKRSFSFTQKKRKKIVILGSIYLLQRFHEKNRKIEHVPIVVAMVTIAGKMCVCTRGGREKFVQLRRRES